LGGQSVRNFAQIIFMFGLMMVAVQFGYPATFTFTGPGSWTDPTKWSPSFPGTTVAINDSVIINGNCTIDPGATVVISPNAAVTNSFGTFLIQGTLRSGGLLFQQNGTITIGGGGSLNNFGVVTGNPNASTLIFNNYGILNNHLDFDFNIGTFSNGNSSGTERGVINNHFRFDIGDFNSSFGMATFINEPLSTFNNYALGTLKKDIDGAILNRGAINIEPDSVLNLIGLTNNEQGGTINNRGAMNLLSGIGQLSNASGATINNNNGGVITVNASHTLSNLVGAAINNNFGATITVNAGGTLNNSSVLNNNPGSTLNSLGAFTLDGGNVNQTGTFSVESSGTLSRTANGGYVIGSVAKTFGTGTFVYHVGTTNGYSPVTL